MNLSRLGLYAGIGAALAALGYVLVRKAAGDTRDVASIIGEGIGQAAAAAAGGLAVGAVKGAGAAVGVPDTDAQLCARAMAAGEWLNASLYCPAAEFIAWAAGREPESSIDGAPAADSGVRQAGAGGVTILPRDQASPQGFEAPGVYAAPIGEPAAHDSGAVLDRGANRDLIR